MPDSVKLPKPKYGQIVVLQKNGDEPRGHGFPLTGTCCVIGRQETADIRVSSADVSLVHCKVVVDDSTGEASLEILGDGTEVNGTVIDPITTLKLSHRDIILIGGRKLRFEYLPPNFKPIPSRRPNDEGHKVSDNPAEGGQDAVKAEVVDSEELVEPEEAAAISDSGAESSDAVPSTPMNGSTNKRVSFGPYLSPEQFDNLLPPATPLKRGATPRRSKRYSGLKFSRATIEPLAEEEPRSTSPAPVNEEDGVVVVNETWADESNASTIALSSCQPRATDAEGDETSTVGVEESILDCVSTVSDVSNTAVIPSECCSFLDDEIESVATADVEEEDRSCASGQASEVPSPVPENDANGLQKLLEESINDNGLDQDSILSETQEARLLQSPQAGKSLIKTPKPLKELSATRVSPKADYTDVRGIKKLLQTPKPVPDTPKADYTDVRGIKKLLETPKPLPDTPKADYTNVVGVKKLLETPKVAPETPKANYTDVAGLKKLMQTPKPAPESPKADYSNVEGIDKLMQTPKVVVLDANCIDIEGIKKFPETHRAALESPCTGYLNVTGVGRLLRTPAFTPKADYSNVEGVKRLLETPKASAMQEEIVQEPHILTEEEKGNDRPISPDSGCQTPPEEVVQTLEDTSTLPKVTKESSSSPMEEEFDLGTDLKDKPAPHEAKEKAVKEEVIHSVTAFTITTSERPSECDKAAESIPASIEVSETESGEEKKVEPLTAMVTPARRGSRKTRQDTPAPTKAEATNSSSCFEDVFGTPTRTPVNRRTAGSKPDTPAPTSKVQNEEVGVVIGVTATPGTSTRRGRKTAEKVQAIPKEQIIEEEEMADQVPVAQVGTKMDEEEVVLASSEVEDDVAEPSKETVVDNVQGITETAPESPCAETDMKIDLAVTDVQDQPEETEEKTQVPTSPVEENVEETPTSSVKATSPTPVKMVTSVVVENESEEKAEELVAPITPARRSTKKAPAKTAIPPSVKMDEIDKEPLLQEILRMAGTSGRRLKKAVTPTPVESLNCGARLEEKETPVLSTPARRGAKKAVTPGRVKTATAAAPKKVEKDEEVDEEAEYSLMETESNNTEKVVAKEMTEEVVQEEAGNEAEQVEAKPASPPTRRRGKKVAEPAVEIAAVKSSTRRGRQAITPVPGAVEVTEKKEKSVQEKEGSPAPVVFREERKALAKKQPVPIVEVARDDKEMEDTEPEEVIKLVTKPTPTGRRNRKTAQVQPEPKEKDDSEPINSPPTRREVRSKATSVSNTPVKAIALRASKRTKSRKDSTEEQGEAVTEIQLIKSSAKKAKKDDPIIELEQPVVRLTRCRVSTSVEASLDSPTATTSPAKPTRESKRTATSGKKESVEPQQPISALDSPVTTASPNKPTRGTKKSSLTSRKESVESEQTTSSFESVNSMPKTTRNKRAASSTKKEQVAQEPELPASPAPAKTTRKTRKQATMEEVEESDPGPAPRRIRSTKAAQKVEGDQEMVEIEVKKPVGRVGRNAPAKTAAVVAVEESFKEERGEVVAARPAPNASKSKRVAQKPVESEEKRRRVTKKSGKSAVPLDDVELMHEGKGHAADIHNHITDSNIEEEEVEEEKPKTKYQRGGKKVVHFQESATVEADIRSGRKTASVRLQREISIDTMVTKKAEVTSSSPIEPPAAKRSRGIKVKVAEQETKASPPRRTTRRTRN